VGNRSRRQLQYLVLFALAPAAACGSVSSGDDPPDARPGGGGEDGGEEADSAPEVRCSAGMAYVPGGTFEMADQPGEVTLEPFCMDITHVTAKDYAACVSCTGAGVTEMCNTDVVSRDLDPQNCVDAAQAAFYCESVDKFLPDETRWEWAARGGEAGNVYAWGDDPPGADDDRLCWHAGRDDQTYPARPSATCPVGFYDQAETQPFGLEDMTGNVWTWTTSEGTTAANRVVRGGGWDNIDPDRMRTGFRNAGIPATTRHYALGFRCAQAPL
jgi:formylglycine-generating enzyme required for sulfatase activity